MTRRIGIGAKARFTAALLAGAGLALALPSAGSAVVGEPRGARDSIANLEFMPFTPAGMDPSLMRELASSVGADVLRFTPAAKPGRRDRTLTVAVRVDRATARAISVRNTIQGAAEVGRGIPSLALAPTRYDLGIARGYQGFTQPAPKATGMIPGVRELTVPDLAEFRPAQPQSKPSRLQPRIAFELEGSAARASRPIESLGEQSVDVGGSYRLTRNLDVTAGVRLSQERDRLAPLTDGLEDNQAVYVGTQFRF